MTAADVARLFSELPEWGQTILILLAFLGILGGFVFYVLLLLGAFK